MSTAVESVSLGKQAFVTQTSLPPAYEDGTTIEFDTLSNASSSSSLPQYESVAPDHASSTAFQPTLSYQVENQGLGCIGLALPPRPYPIPIYAVTSSGLVTEKVYESIRPARRSGNCTLYAAGSADEVPLCTTTYRFGPGRPPKIRLLGPDQSPSALDTEAPLGSSEEEFDVISRGCTTRAVVIRTHLGTFQWRYAKRAERKAIGTDSLVVFEKITTVAHAGGKTSEEYKRIAQLVRNDEYRTSGSGRSTAGNGGRLMMDLREWSADRKGDAKQIELLIVSSCICMLKKEMDRRRMQRAGMMSGGGGGGS